MVHSTDFPLIYITVWNKGGTQIREHGLLPEFRLTPGEKDQPANRGWWTANQLAAPGQQQPAAAKNLCHFIQWELPWPKSSATVRSHTGNSSNCRHWKIICCSLCLPGSHCRRPELREGGGVDCKLSLRCSYVRHILLCALSELCFLSLKHLSVIWLL